MCVQLALISNGRNYCFLTYIKSYEDEDEIIDEFVSVRFSTS
jgi:hypothetical protein